METRKEILLCSSVGKEIRLFGLRYQEGKLNRYEAVYSIEKKG